MTKRLILSIAVNAPLYQSFDYYLPLTSSDALPCLGARVLVEFGRRQILGFILAIKPADTDANNTLKPILKLLDCEPVLTDPILKLMQWAAEYYHHPLGECLTTALPNALCKMQALTPLTETFYVLSTSAPASLSNKTQNTLLEAFETHKSLSKAQIKTLKLSQSSVKTFVRNQWLDEKSSPIKAPPCKIKPSPLALNPEQQQVIEQFNALANQFFVALLEGVTGSGKTEVYLRLMATVLAQDKQVLMLVPEIGLTPQTIERLKQRFDCEMAIFHSNLTDKQRLIAWQKAKQGIAKIIIGTRSALFTATDTLGLIIIDEEHDLSYKQQDGLRYSARDLACIRAKLENIPLILGSATPTLESLNNAITGKYQHWQMTQRAGNASAPSISLLDIRKQAVHHGISEASLNAIGQCLEQGEQALLFINRRGFAPSLICHDCGWVAQCDACDSHLTTHQQSQQLRCHHCGISKPIPQHCPQCRSQNLIKTGAGTERIALALAEAFPNIPLYRIDRDTTQNKNALPAMVKDIQKQQAAILIGTQMLAKGHHFPNVTLVVVIDSDQSLVSTDYRSIERFGQLITQVTGRAGREQKPGQAIIQTHYPDHPQLIKLIHWPYQRFALDLLAMRKQLHLPPFSAQALIRLEDKQADSAFTSLNNLKQKLQALPCLILGPTPASLQRRAWHYRYQLLIQCKNRKDLHHTVDYIIKNHKGIIKSTQRWSVDIDPQDMS